VVLTPLSGNPDLVISLNPDNQFPDKDNHDFISENNFTTDSIIIEAVNFTERYGLKFP